MKLFAVTIALLGISDHALGAPIVDAGCDPTATIQGGVVVGTTKSVDATTINQFLGIPFAAAPTGAQRFSPPRPTSWSEPLDTKAFKPACIQVFNPWESRDYIQDVFSVPRPEESEDCLYLNVWAPTEDADQDDGCKKPYPVLYWMYGGGFKFGNAGQPIYDGSHFASLEKVIVVSVNYRTNLFGFPIAPDVANLTERNLGLLDQRAGLDWVQENIAAFGGDPNRVTIFGQSAGSYAVDVLLTNPWPAGPPFHAAIMESGTYSYNPVANCNNTDYTAWKKLLDRVNCTNATLPYECVKSTSVDDLRYAQEEYGISFGMAGDNITIVCDPRLRREGGNFARVPVIGGSNVDDGSYYGAKNGTDIDRYFDTVFHNETALKAKVLAAYTLNPAEGRHDNLTILSQIATDWNFHCPAVFLSNSSTRYVPTYRYLFNATFPNQRLTDLPDDRWPVAEQGAYHQSEVPLVFSTYNATGTTPEQKQLSDIMRSTWARFARDPWAKTGPLEGWGVAGEGAVDVNGTATGVKGQKVMVFGADGKAGLQFGKDRTGKCGVWLDFITKKHL